MDIDKVGEKYAELRKLIEGARPMTPEEQEAQRFDWAYGNLACSTNHKPSRAAFLWLAQERGWAIEQFHKWAADKEWLP
jgi:hypothetical protein